MIRIVEEAAEKVGGIVALARELGIKHPSLHSWTRVPAERVLKIEKLTGIPRHRIRPDLYDAPLEAAE
ncbi:MAG: YdaS family helix-turn-helix protein [Pseudorhizobium pelagicum]|uniref:transcriptional regulator n=1 Tax=Pseudorhizobium pelagicum TaxID=1509405 RepID=UPI00345F1BF5